jgi:hypothetical protein
MTFLTHATKTISKGFQNLCDMAEETLEAAVNRIYPPADELLPQHAGELELSALSEEELKQLSSCSAQYELCDEKTCREKLQSLRGARERSPADLANKANKAINALRARLTLLQREKSGNAFRARSVSTSVQLSLSVLCCCCLPHEPCVVSACLPAGAAETAAVAAATAAAALAARTVHAGTAAPAAAAAAGGRSSGQWRFIRAQPCWVFSFTAVGEYGIMSSTCL